jgi:3-oxoacyl-[acyl-carrier-protein] synthase II
MAKRRRVVITGMGVVTALGETLDGFWSGLCEGRSGIGPLTLFDTTEFKVHFGGQVRDWDPAARFGTKEARHLDRFAQFAMAASMAAVEDSGISFESMPLENCGVIIGSGIGGLNEFETQHSAMIHKGPSRISPFTIPKLMVNAASGQVSIRWGLRGPNSAVATACASAANAIGDAFRAIQTGMADVMITGGSEAAITHMGLGGFAAMRALSTRNDDPTHASRPFDRDRDGFILGEGAGMLILEDLEHAKARKATIYGEVVGYGSTADAFRITDSHDQGRGAIACMRQAMADAQVSPEDIDYINAHGTSTAVNDSIETLAIKRTLGETAYNVPISSTKSMMGHLIAAAGSVEAIVCLLTIRDGVMPPTVNLDNPDEDCDLDYIPHEARRKVVDVTLTNSFGFGGQNIALILRRFAG